MPKVSVNGIKFHYWQVGSGPHMIFLHGLTGNLAAWHFTQVPAFRDEYRILTYDLRGHGHSDMPPTGYTTYDMAEDLRGIMDALDIESAHLVGHSLGADIALQFALLYPERVEKIVAIEAGLAALAHVRKRTDWPGWGEWAKGIEKYSGIKVPREKWGDIDYMLRESFKVPVIFGPGRGQARKSDNMLRLLDTTTLVQDYEDSSGMTLDALRGLMHEVLLIYGTDSQYLGTYDVLRETLPNCRVGLIEGGEHFGLLHQPEALFGPMRSFLQEQPQESEGVLQDVEGMTGALETQS